MNAARKAPITETRECQACQHAFKAVYRYIGLCDNGYRPRFEWDKLCEMCTLLHEALAKMEEAKALISRAKELAAERKT